MERQRLRQILVLALPIIGGMVSQNVLNLVDTLMVSRLGPEALAAVGFGGFANFMASAFITGMGVGVQAVAARRKGEGRESEMAVPLNGGLVIAAVIAIPLSVALFLLTPHFFPLLSTDADVVDLGVPYLRARLVAMVALGMNFAFRGYWNGVNLSRLYLKTLLIMHACNVFLNFALIFGYFGFPELGSTGAGIGTAASTFIGTGAYFILGMKHARRAGFLSAVPKLSVLGSLFRLSLPESIRSLLFATGLTTLFTIIDRIGTNEVAAAQVVVNLSLVAYLPALGLGLAAASLVGQALGRRDVDDAAAWGWDVSRVAIVVLAVIGLPMLLIPDLLLQAFFSEEPEVLAIAVWPLRITGLTIAVEGLGMVFLQACMGAGATRLSMAVAVGTQWAVFLPAAYLVGPVLGGGLIAVWLAQSGYRVLQAAIMMAVWKRRTWATVQL